MRIALISALAENFVIGSHNDLPWHLPDDFRHFKRTTRGHHVIMGRRTWESRGKPLPKRTNIVVSSQPDYAAPGAAVVASLDAALALARAADEPEAFVIGGTRLYTEALPLAERLYLTRVHAEVEGDTYFPRFDPLRWRVVESVEHPADERHVYAFTIETLELAG